MMCDVLGSMLICNISKDLLNVSEIINWLCAIIVMCPRVIKMQVEHRNMLSSEPSDTEMANIEAKKNWWVSDIITRDRLATRVMEANDSKIKWILWWQRLLGAEWRGPSSQRDWYLIGWGGSYVYSFY